MPSVPTILFTRQLKGFAGGHLKVFDYMGHVTSNDWVSAQLYLTPDSDRELASHLTPAGVLPVPAIGPADCHFVAGMDWDLLDRAGFDPDERPVINLVQHVRHADPADPRYRFLRRRALRICVSPEVGDALRATGIANGPIEVIPNGLDLAGLQHHRRSTPAQRIFLGGLKNPALGQACAAALAARGIPMDVCLTSVPRAEFLDRLANSQLCILLPKATEGFFLPALEAMALGVPPVVPDCVGARSFAVHEETCLVPDATPHSVVEHALRLWADISLRQRIISRARIVAYEYTLERERTRFLGLLRQALQGG